MILKWGDLMTKKLAILALAVSFLTQFGCQRPQAVPLRIETAWVESSGEKTILALDRGGDYGLVVDGHGLLVITFDRMPAFKEIEGLFGTDLTYHLVDRELRIVVSPGIDRRPRAQRLCCFALFTLRAYPYSRWSRLRLLLISARWHSYKALCWGGGRPYRCCHRPGSLCS